MQGRDGSGYPRNLLAEQITIESRILRVADVFDALVEVRPYERAVARVEAIAWMRSLEGKVDATCLAALERVLAGDAQRIAGKRNRE